MSKQLEKLLNDGVPMSQELKKELAKYEEKKLKFNKAGDELKAIRQLKEESQEILAEGLAEDEIQFMLTGQLHRIPSEEHIREIHERLIGPIITAEYKKFESKLALGEEMFTQKRLVEKTIADMNKMHAEGTKGSEQKKSKR